jgi:hypothetical protein
MSSADLSLWARIDGLDRDAVRHALWTEKSLLKVWATRGTLYLLPVRDLRVWFSALGASPKHHNVGHRYMDELTDAVGRALASAMLSREELALAVLRLTGSETYAQYVRFSWGSYLKAAAFRGVLCFGPSAGGSIRLTSPGHWLGYDVPRMPADDALAELTRQFLRAYGPCTPEELSAWWEGPPRPRRGARMLSLLAPDEVADVDVEGFSAKALAADVAAMAATKPRNVARLLPAFDPWTIGAARHPPLQLDAYEARVHRPQGWVSPVILVNGRIVGVWRHTTQGRTTRVELEPFERLPSWARESLEGEAERLAVFLNGRVELTWTSDSAE